MTAPEAERCVQLREAGHCPVLRSGTLMETKRATIVEALRVSEGNRDKAAQRLDMGRTTLYRKLRELQIHPAEYFAFVPPGFRV